MKELKPVKDLVNACLSEALDKHIIDIFEDDYLNPDYHIEVTLTVREIKLAAIALGIKEVK